LKGQRRRRRKKEREREREREASELFLVYYICVVFVTQCVVCQLSCFDFRSSYRKHSCTERDTYPVFLSVFIFYHAQSPRGAMTPRQGRPTPQPDRLKQQCPSPSDLRPAAGARLDDINSSPNSSSSRSSSSSSSSSSSATGARATRRPQRPRKEL